MHWKTELENRIENSLFTRHGLVSTDHVAIRFLDTPLIAECGWHFDKGCGKGWSGPYPTKAHARAELGVHLTDEEDMLVRALTGVADFTHAPWLKTRWGAGQSGNEGLVVGYYRFVGEHVHVIRFHAGFISAVAVKLNRIERMPLPNIQSALRDSDSFLIVKVEGDSMAQTVVLSPADSVTILPATVEEDCLYGVTARSVSEAIKLFDAMDHNIGDD